MDEDDLQFFLREPFGQITSIEYLPSQGNLALCGAIFNLI
jgi:hypothetical protein